jgi:hypothetical protein
MPAGNAALPIRPGRALAGPVYPAAPAALTVAFAQGRRFPMDCNRTVYASAGWRLANPCPDRLRA